MRVATISLEELKGNCEQAFVKPRNRTLERYKFFARKQVPKETLRQFWRTLTGVASKCAFEEQTESLIMDTFIQNMNNKMVQQSCVPSPKTTPKMHSDLRSLVKKGLANTKHSKVEEGKTKMNLCT